MQGQGLPLPLSRPQLLSRPGPCPWPALLRRCWWPGPDLALDLVLLCPCPGPALVPAAGGPALILPLILPLPCPCPGPAAPPRITTNVDAEEGCPAGF